MEAIKARFSNDIKHASQACLYSYGMSPIAERIWELLRARHFAEREIISELAATCGISYQAVSFWADGSTKKIGASHLVKIARKYGSTVEWLQDGRGEMLSGEMESPLEAGIRVLAQRLTPAEWAYLKQQGEEMIARRMHHTPEPAFAEITVPGPATHPTTIAELGEMQDKAIKAETLVQNAQPYIEQHKKFNKAKAEERKAARAAARRAEKAKTDKKVEGDGGQPSPDQKPKK